MKRARASMRDASYVQLVDSTAHNYFEKCRAQRQALKVKNFLLLCKIFWKSITNLWIWVTLKIVLFHIEQIYGAKTTEVMNFSQFCTRKNQKSETEAAALILSDILMHVSSKI